MLIPTLREATCCHACRHSEPSWVWFPPATFCRRGGREVEMWQLCDLFEPECPGPAPVDPAQGGSAVLLSP